MEEGSSKLCTGRGLGVDCPNIRAWVWQGGDEKGVAKCVCVAKCVRVAKCVCVAK